MPLLGYSACSSRKGIAAGIASHRLYLTLKHTGRFFSSAKHLEVTDSWGGGTEMVLKCQILYCWNISQLWITKQHGFIGGQKEVELKLELITMDAVQ